MKLYLLEKRPLVGDIVSFTFKPENEITWQPGQYMHYVINHKNPDNRGIERWFTISSAPFEKNIVITTRIFVEKKSSFKTALYNLNVGEKIEADGPKGKFTLNNPKVNNIFLAGGIGITPFRSMFAQANHNDQKINGYLLYLNRDDNFVFRKEFEQVLSNIGVRSNYSKTIDDSFFSSEKTSPETNYYLSGPEPMVEHYNNLLVGMGLPDEQIFTDFFPGYLWESK
ncbi:MAG: FAD-dependent oxidoreductase [Patescibacteria group bacterium]|jgi:ferredoxin-NADP reductase|nr:FAD-dependent oxidoreductase [Patescibacteria group bacterium]